MQTTATKPHKQTQRQFLRLNLRSLSQRTTLGMSWLHSLCAPSAHGKASKPTCLSVVAYGCECAARTLPPTTLARSPAGPCMHACYTTSTPIIHLNEPCQAARLPPYIVYITLVHANQQQLATCPHALGWMSWRLDSARGICKWPTHRTNTRRKKHAVCNMHHRSMSQQGVVRCSDADL